MARQLKSHKKFHLHSKKNKGARTSPKKHQLELKQENFPSSTSGPRKLQSRSFKDRWAARKESKRNYQKKKIPSSFRIFYRSIQMLKENWRAFLGVTIIYGILNAFLVHGFSFTVGLSATKKANDLIYHGFFGQIGNGLNLFSSLLKTTGNGPSATANVYQAILIIIVSLALIWGLRQIYAGYYIRVRDTFYQGMTPLIVVLLVFVVMIFELVPLFIASTLYVNVFTSGVAVNGFQQVLWGVACFLLALPTLYFWSASIFAIYISTLPEMTPLKALRSARNLVRFRRLAIARRLLFIPVVLFLLALIIMLPIVLLLTPIAPFIFLAMGLSAITFLHSYLYSLYRALL